MREKVEKLLQGKEVIVKTFHSFCPELIKQFGSLSVDFFFFPRKELQNFALQEYEVKLSNERAFKGILKTLWQNQRFKDCIINF